MPARSAYRRYVRSVLPTMAVYVALIIALPFVIRATGASGPLLWAIALAPSLPLIGVFALIGRLLVELDDEYLRMIEVRKALVATGVAMAFSSAWGFLDVYAGAPHLPLFFAPIAWFAGLGVGSAVNAAIERRASA